MDWIVPFGWRHKVRLVRNRGGRLPFFSLEKSCAQAQAACVGEEPERIIRVVVNSLPAGQGGHDGFDFIECLFLGVAPVETLCVQFGAGQQRQHPHIFLKAPDEFFHPLNSANELFHSLCQLGGWPITNVGHLAIVCSHPSFGDPRAQEFDAIAEELGLIWAEVQVGFLEAL